MCTVCNMLDNNKMTNEEALRAVGELLLAKKSDQHLLSIIEKIMVKEVPYKERDLEMEALASEELRRDRM